MWQLLWARYKDSNFRTNVLFCLILCVNLALLFLVCKEISIHHQEAYGVFYSQDFIFQIARFSLELFGYNDFALRLPFITLHSLNMLLLYRLSRIYLKKPRDSIIVILVYALLPGVMFSAIFVIKSGLIIFIALLCCFIQLRFNKTPYPILFLAIFIDGSFAILFFAYFFYALKTKNTLTMVLSLLFFAFNMYLFGLGISGTPRNHLLGSLGKMLLFFSPLLFIYYVYTLYNALRKQTNLLVEIGATSLFFAILLSLRQDVDLETIFPMSVIALPVAIKQFFSDMRIRLPAFRFAYSMRFAVIFFLLCAQNLVLYGNKFLYLFGVERHFASSHYISKDLAQLLKSKDIYAIQTSNNRLELALRFYGIENKSKQYLIPVSDLNKQYKNEIPIKYLGKKVASFVIADSPNAKPIVQSQNLKKSSKP